MKENLLFQLVEPDDHGDRPCEMRKSFPYCLDLVRSSVTQVSAVESGKNLLLTLSRQVDVVRVSKEYLKRATAYQTGSSSQIFDILRRTVEG